MKSVMFAAALLVGTAAYAQDTGMAGGQTVAPSNAAPERDARGVPVISAPATAPAGYNLPPGTPGAAPASGTAPTMGSAGDLPPCTRKVTDHCTQTYERNHGPAAGSSDTATATDTSGTDTATADTGTGTKKVVHHRRRAHHRR
jgi:hypothetical protein